MTDDQASIDTMTIERYNELSQSGTLPLTPEEIAEGWHFCWEFDGLLIHPSHPEAKFCTCK